MPVIDLKCKYILPALYDEEITVKVFIDKMPSLSGYISGMNYIMKVVN